MNFLKKKDGEGALIGINLLEYLNGLLRLFG